MGIFLLIKEASSFWPVLPKKIVHLLGGISFLVFLLLNGDSLGFQKARVT